MWQCSSIEVVVALREVKFTARREIFRVARLMISAKAKLLSVDWLEYEDQPPLALYLTARP
jgi:hypothetical protein